MYYFTNSPTILTDLPNDLTCSIASTDDGRFIAVSVNNDVYFHCQKSLTLLGLYRHKPQSVEAGGNFVYIAWNSTSDILLLRTDLGFLFLVYLSLRELDQLDLENKIIAGDRSGRVFCLNWLGEVLQQEGFDLHSIAIQSEFGSNAGNTPPPNSAIFSVTSHIDLSVNCQNFHWAPTLGGFLVTLTNRRLLLVILPLSRLVPECIRVVWLTSVEDPSAISVNSRFRGFAVGTSKGQITSYHLEETSNMPISSLKFRLPDPARHGIDKMPDSVKTLAWSPDGYCLAVAWSTHGMALWSVFGSLLYSTLLDQTEVTRFLAPLNFCWTLKGFHLWTISTFVDYQDRRAREECLNAFKVRILHSCNALPQTQLQVAKNVAKMRSDLHLDGGSGDHNRNFLMVFHLAKSVLASNPTEDNHLHLLLCTPDAFMVTIRRFLHSRRTMLHVPLPLAYIRANFPLKFAALNSQGNQVVVAGSRGFAVCVLSSLRWRLFGNVSQEQTFEVHAGLAWWGRFICFSAFNYVVSHCEIRCYPTTEKLDDRFASIVTLENSIRPLILDIVGNCLIIFSTDSHYRSFDLSVGPKPHEVVMTPHSTFNLASFFPHAVCLTRILPFSLHSRSSSVLSHTNHNETPRQARDAETEDSTLLATYAGNLLLLPNLRSSLTGPQSGDTSSALAGFFGFGGKKNTNTRKYQDTFSPTLIASRVELLWSPTANTPCTSTIQRPAEVLDFSDDEEEEEEEEEEDDRCCRETRGFPLAKERYGTYVSTPPPLLRDSIWLFCGADGMRIWLPLDTSSVRRSSGGASEVPLPSGVDKKSPGVYVPLGTALKASRRVMVSLGLDELSYPLVIFPDKAVFVTVQSDYLRVDRSYSDLLADLCIQMPCCCITFKTNLFLPHLLKDLLRKNLSNVAYDLAAAYQYLPYFQHILELLLHQVLEEEATSKYPIPDPLLPQVTAFVEQFPHFLDVVVQCTRKTEVTWWRYLFCALGRRPKDIFDHAISLEQLDTAASCLVILQNSETQATCKQCALLLFETAIRQSQWHHVRDLMRFLKATTLSEHSKDVLNEVDAFVEHVKCRFLQEGSWKSLEEIFANLSPQSSLQVSVPTVQDRLSEPTEALNSFLPQWLLANREHVMHVDDWPRCFLRLHSDFGWFLSIGIQKEDVLACTQKRPGFAQAVNGMRTDSIANSETYSYIRHYNSTEEASTFYEALRAQQQVLLLLNHLLMVVRELKPPTPESFFGPSEEALFCWTLIVAILQMDKEAVISVFSLLPKTGVYPTNGIDAIPSSPASSSSSSPPTLLRRILNGIEALERLISADPQATPEYSNFFTELKPIIRKVVQPFMERNHAVPVEKRSIRLPSTCSGSNLVPSCFIFSTFMSYSKLMHWHVICATGEKGMFIGKENSGEADDGAEFDVIVDADAEGSGSCGCGLRVCS
ncbi:protein RIC1 [Echinococcus multilocularis]|uniref:Protein RIC1 homolog n=1 Tax=Echinococcus multilocularis TaxID=6211 RepID=A0A068YAS8_ECHMU|nr:protein RIC1 [Echinococcus multilocularis]